MVRRAWPYVFAAWTVYVWITAIRNIGGPLTVALSVVFFALAALVAVPSTRARAMWPLAGLTTAVWGVALVVIWVRDHAIGFKVVHTVIAAISIALAVAAVRSLRGEGDVEGQREATTGAAGLQEFVDP